MLAELEFFQYEIFSVLNNEAKLKLKEFDSKKMVTNAERSPLNTFFFFDI